MRSSILSVLAALTFGCAPRNYRTYQRGESLRDDQVVILGTAVIDPPIVPNPLSADPFRTGIYEQLTMTFSSAPDDPLATDTYPPNLGLKSVEVFPGRPFAIVMPRRRTFLRGFIEYSTFSLIYDRFLPEKAPIYFVCSGRAELDIQPTDQYVDIGEVHCDQRAPSAGFTVQSSGPVVLRMAPLRPVERHAQPLPGGSLPVGQLSGCDYLPRPFGVKHSGCP